MSQAIPLYFIAMAVSAVIVLIVCLRTITGRLVLALYLTFLGYMALFNAAYVFPSDQIARNGIRPIINALVGLGLVQSDRIGQAIFGIGFEMFAGFLLITILANQLKRKRARRARSYDNALSVVPPRAPVQPFVAPNGRYRRASAIPTAYDPNDELAERIERGEIRGDELGELINRRRLRIRRG